MSEAVHLQTLVAAFEMNTKLFTNCLDGVDDTLAVRRTSGETNHMAFIACHLVDVRHYLANLLGAEAGSSFGGRLDKIRSIEDLADWPALAEIEAAWAEISPILVGRLAASTDADLAKPVEPDFPIADRSLLGGVLFLLSHESFHLGQLSLLRKHFGLTAMSWKV